MRQLFLCLALVSVMFTPQKAQSKFAFPSGSMQPIKCETQDLQTGIASWYGEECQGRMTASGELFDMNKLTAAHPILPLGTIVRVTDLSNCQSILLRLNDRGPGVPGRIIDVSREAARRLGFEQAGLAKVSVAVIRLPKHFVLPAAISSSVIPGKSPARRGREEIISIANLRRAG
jgi:rare lipoprotein A (peptidoglycan hydrolase)